MTFRLSSSILFKKITNIPKKIVRLNYKNVFLKNCRTSNVVPASLRVKALVKSKRGNIIASQTKNF